MLYVVSKELKLIDKIPETKKQVNRKIIKV